MQHNPSLYADENLLARLDRTPITKTTIGIIVLLSIVWLAEAFDIGIVGPVLTVLKSNWHLTQNDMGLLGIASTVGVVLGMIPAGILADRFGRRKVVLYGMLIFSIITMAGALTHAVWQLVAVRLLAGIGEGAVLPMPYLFLSEFVHSKRRAVSIGYSNGVLTAAYLIPNLAALWALHTFSSDMAWRVPFYLGGIPLILLIPLAIWLPESPRYLLKNNKREQVMRLVEKLENEAGLPHDTELINRKALVVIQKGANTLPTAKVLFRSPYLQRGMIVAAQLTAALVLFYILLVFGPTLLMSRGFGNGSAILFTGLMMAMAGIGSIVQGYLADRYGRKKILTTYFLLAAIGAGMFGLFSSPAWVIFAGFLTSFFGLGVFPVSKLTVAEQYPTRLRGHGVYSNEMAARILSGIVTIYFIPLLLNMWGNRVIFEGIAIAILLLALPFVIFGRETANISVEEAGTDLSFSELESAMRNGTSGNKVTT
jgi:putative MFS transporter